MVKSLLERYNLPSIYDLLRNPPGKFTWKDQVKRTVFSHWEEKLRDEASSKSSLKYLDIKKLKLGKTHLLWTNAGFETTAITKAIVKCRLLLRVYTLQANIHKFNQYEVDPTCPLCKLGPDDRTHFLVTCERLQTHRLEYPRYWWNTCNTHSDHCRLLFQSTYQSTLLCYNRGALQRIMLRTTLGTK